MYKIQIYETRILIIYAWKFTICFNSCSAIDFHKLVKLFPISCLHYSPWISNSACILFSVCLTEISNHSLILCASFLWLSYSKQSIQCTLLYFCSNFWDDLSLILLFTCELLIWYYRKCAFHLWAGQCVPELKLSRNKSNDYLSGWNKELDGISQNIDSGNRKVYP